MNRPGLHFALTLAPLKQVDECEQLFYLPIIMISQLTERKFVIDIKDFRLLTRAPTPYGTGDHVPPPPLLQMAGHGGTVNRTTATIN